MLAKNSLIYDLPNLFFEWNNLERKRTDPGLGSRRLHYRRPRVFLSLVSLLARKSLCHHLST